MLRADGGDRFDHACLRALSWKHLGSTRLTSRRPLAPRAVAKKKGRTDLNRRSVFKMAVFAGMMTLVGACAPAMMDSEDIIDIAAGNEDFSTLVAAVQVAGHAEMLRGPGPFTVFAPTNAGFAARPAGAVKSLLQPETIDQLTAMLAYHVVPGAVMSYRLAGMQLSVTTVQGSTIELDGTDGVRINTAIVTTADILTPTGVTHVIDTVLLPQ